MWLFKTFSGYPSPVNTGPFFPACSSVNWLQIASSLSDLHPETFAQCHFLPFPPKSLALSTRQLCLSCRICVYGASLNPCLSQDITLSCLGTFKAHRWSSPDPTSHLLSPSWPWTSWGSLTHLATPHTLPWPLLLLSGTFPQTSLPFWTKPYVYQPTFQCLPIIKSRFNSSITFPRMLKSLTTKASSFQGAKCRSYEVFWV